MLGYLLVAIPTPLAISAVIFVILALAPSSPLGNLATHPGDLSDHIVHQYPGRSAAPSP